MSYRVYADLGNMTLHWALQAGDCWLAADRICSGEGLADRCVTSLRAMLRRAGQNPDGFGGGLFCSSCPAQTETLLQALQGRCGMAVDPLTADMLATVPTAYHDRSQLGPDRLLNAAAVRAHHQVPAVVADVGSCITVDLIDAEGVLVGGAISPGLPVIRAGLSAWTPHLRPALDAMTAPQDWHRPGRSTAECISLGVYSTVMAVTRQLCNAFATEAQGAQVLLTGGDARWLHEGTGFGDVLDEMLTLKGLHSLDRT